VPRAWEAARKKRGDLRRRERLGGMAIHVAAYAVLLQVLMGDDGVAGKSAGDNAAEGGDGVAPGA
jgi:hypothetical protein